MQSLTQCNVQEQEGGTEATAMLHRGLPSLFRHRMVHSSAPHDNLEPIGLILRKAWLQIQRRIVLSTGTLMSSTGPTLKHLI